MTAPFTTQQGHPGCRRSGRAAIVPSADGTKRLGSTRWLEQQAPLSNPSAPSEDLSRHTVGCVNDIQIQDAGPLLNILLWLPSSFKKTSKLIYLTFQALEQWFSNFGLHGNHWKSFLKKCRVWFLTPKVLI